MDKMKLIGQLSLLKSVLRSTNVRVLGLHRLYSSSVAPKKDDDGRAPEFTKLDLLQTSRPKREPFKRRERKPVPPPRYKNMKTDQDWPSVWPVQRSFHPATVPLPVHQGWVYPKSSLTIPSKWGNLELMKIPNFLHLTPPAIHRHCEALKKFCTPWPEELKTDGDIQSALPLEVISSDYCHSIPSIRDIRSRITTLRIQLSSLFLDEHAKDKFTRLVGDRYDRETDTVTILTDSCPYKKQNYDHGLYILTALYQESWSKEKWEEEKEIEDMEKWEWEGSVAQTKMRAILQDIATSEGAKPQYLAQLDGPIETEDLKKVGEVQEFVGAIEELHNKEENLETLADYGSKVRALFNLPNAL